MDARSIAFIGGGNMAAALISGLVASQGASGDAPGVDVVVSDPTASRRDALAERYGVRTTDSNLAAIDGADVVVLAVKPQQIAGVAHELAPSLRPEQLVVSVAAGITVGALVKWLGGHSAVVRVMPNTPSMVGCGAAGLFATAAVSEDDRSNAESLMRSVGLVQWVDQEADLDSVTALSGSGPAYVFLVMEAMEAAARELGLSAESARLLTLETVYGAARLAMTAGEAPAELRAKVTSPGGTTERGIRQLEAAGLRQAFRDAMQAAHDRSRELGEALSETD